MSIQALQLGKITLPHNLIQAPLAGISCAPFRAVMQRYGAPAFCCTEMISAKHWSSHGEAQRNRYTYKAPEEGVLCFQISGADRDDIAKATELATASGADIIDLNAGCPVPKMRAKGVGSKLLHDPEHLQRLTETMRAHTDKTISVKIRVAAGHDDVNHVQAAQAIEAGGADFITVHGRHWTERYETPCHYEDIAQVVQAVSIPVIGNGDIKDSATLATMFDKAGCAGVMIGRAGVGQPWLFRQLLAEANDEPFMYPSLNQVAQVFLEHVEGLMALEGEGMAVLQSRKFAKYYFRPHLFLPERQESRKAWLAAQNDIASWEKMKVWVERGLRG